MTTEPDGPVVSTPAEPREPDDLDRLLAEQLQDPAFVRVWLATQEREVESRERAAYERGKAEGIAEERERLRAMRLNGPMVQSLRRAAADTSPNWDGAVTVYPPGARQLVALIDALNTAGGSDA